MIGIGIGINKTIFTSAGEGSSFDADYQAVLDYGTTQGYTLPSLSQQVLQNQLVKDLKAAGIWSKLDIFYVFATDGDSDFASINWKDPNNFEITEVNSPTFTTNVGFTGNASSAYLNTNWSVLNDSVNFEQNNATIGAYGVLNTTYDVGVRIGFNTSMSCLYQASAIRLNGDTVNVSNGQGTHLLQHNRINSSNVSQYINGVLTDSAISTSDPLADLQVYILALNANLVTSFFNSNTYNVVYLGANLESEASDIYTAIYTNYLANL
jgi:hypothetical protein